MDDRHAVSRRTFLSGVSAVGASLIARPALAQQPRSAAAVPAAAPAAPAVVAPRARLTVAEYDAMAKLASNENPYGPPESVLKAMTDAMKYANRYGYPDGDVTQAIADHHGVKTDHILLGAGSGEILDIVGTALLLGGRKVIGVEPSYSQVYSHATSIKTEAITLPLTKDYRQDIGAMITATKRHYREVGFVYLCNPNNPTGVIVTKSEIKTLLDGIPDDVPVLIDEAYHHFVDDSNYATSVPYVLEGRRVIVARTFSKIAALAGMRLGYAIAPPDIIQMLRPFETGTINALVRWGGAAAIKDTASQAHVKQVTIEVRERTIARVKDLGFAVIPSQTNFFMIHLKKPVPPVIEEFRKQGVAVGRPFPPMTEHLRVSVGTPAEMDRFVTAFQKIMLA